jgi:hypothetical protein
VAAATQGLNGSALPRTRRQKGGLLGLYPCSWPSVPAGQTSPCVAARVDNRVSRDLWAEALRR